MLPRWVSDFNVVTSHFAQCGFEVTVYAPRADDSAPSGWRSAAEIEAAAGRLHPGVRLEFFPYSNHRIGALAVLRNLLLVVRLARCHKDALFMLWTITPIVLCGPILRALDRRCIYMITGLGSVFSESSRRRWTRRIVERVYRWLFAAPRSRLIVHNEQNKRFLAARFRLDPDRIVVTPGCGVDPDLFPAAPLQRKAIPVILVPVRLLVHKGILDAAQASALLTAAGVRHEMWFTSNVDSTHPYGVQQADVDRLSGAIPGLRFIGHQPDLLAVYGLCDIVCVPTYYEEGLPTSLLEAAAVGRPIVTCESVGCNEFVRDGIEGLLVPPRDPQALAAALQRVLLEPGLAQRLKDGARARFLEGYTKHVMLERTLATVRSLGFPVADPQ
jgi:glycosyltransferase involved in cell wall biosynthesis